MKLRTVLGIVAGTGLLLGASIVYGQSQTVPSHAVQIQNCQTPMMNHMSYQAGMAGMRGTYMKNGAMNGQAGMHSMLQRLEAAIQQARTATDPAKVKSALNEAEEQIIQFMNHIGVTGNRGGMMSSYPCLHTRHMTNQPPTTNP